MEEDRPREEKDTIFIHIELSSVQPWNISLVLSTPSGEQQMLFPVEGAHDDISCTELVARLLAVDHKLANTFVLEGQRPPDITGDILFKESLSLAGKWERLSEQTSLLIDSYGRRDMDTDEYHKERAENDIEEERLQARRALLRSDKALNTEKRRRGGAMLHTMSALKKTQEPPYQVSFDTDPELVCPILIGLVHEGVEITNLDKLVKRHPCFADMMAPEAFPFSPIVIRKAPLEPDNPELFHYQFEITPPDPVMSTWLRQNLELAEHQTDGAIRNIVETAPGKYIGCVVDVKSANPIMDVLVQCIGLSFFNPGDAFIPEETIGYVYGGEPGESDIIMARAATDTDYAAITFTPMPFSSTAIVVLGVTIARFCKSHNVVIDGGKNPYEIRPSEGLVSCKVPMHIVRDLLTEIEQDSKIAREGLELAGRYDVLREILPSGTQAANMPPSRNI